MPKNLQDFKVDIIQKINDQLIILPADFKQEFVNNVHTCMTRLIHAYDVDDILKEKVRMHVVLTNLFLVLKCRTTENYIISISKTSLSNDLSGIIQRSFIAAAPELVSLQTDITRFIANNNDDFIALLLNKLQTPMFKLDIILSALAKEISNRFITDVRIMCGYDVYSKFTKCLEEQFTAIIPYIEAETNIQGIEDAMLKYAPTSYIYNNPSVRARDISSDPCSFMHYIGQRLFLDFISIYTPEAVSVHIMRIKANANKHKRYLQTLQSNLTAAESYNVVIHFQRSLSTIKDIIEQHANSMVLEFYNAYLSNLGYEWASTYLQEYKNGVSIKWIQRILFARIYDQIADCYILPKFLSEPARETPQITNFKKGLILHAFDIKEY